MINQERIEILNRIKQLEKERKFDCDVENDPPNKILNPQDVDYLRKKWKNKLKRFFVSRGAEKAIDGLISSGQLIISNVIGEENLKEVKGAAFITSNHFHPFENIAIYKTFQKYANKHTFYRIIREGNFTSPPKGFDLFFRHCNTLPLSSNPRTMQKFLEALKKLSEKSSYFLIYPEQAMWWNYPKPRPFKDGAFKFAYKLNIPIIPCFITMNDSPIYKDSDGLPVKEYTKNIGKPIYPNKQLCASENVISMKETNFNFCQYTYEKTYGVKLEYES